MILSHFSYSKCYAGFSTLHTNEATGESPGRYFKRVYTMSPNPNASGVPTALVVVMRLTGFPATNVGVLGAQSPVSCLPPSPKPASLKEMGMFPCVL